MKEVIIFHKKRRKKAASGDAFKHPDSWPFSNRFPERRIGVSFFSGSSSPLTFANNLGPNCFVESSSLSVRLKGGQKTLGKELGNQPVFWFTASDDRFWTLLYPIWSRRDFLRHQIISFRTDLVALHFLSSFKCFPDGRILTMITGNLC